MHMAYEKGNFIKYAPRLTKITLKLDKKFIKVVSKICSNPIFCQNMTKITLKLITAKICPIKKKKNCSYLCTSSYFLLSFFSTSQFSSSRSLTFTSSSLYSSSSSLCRPIFKNHGKFLFFD